MVTTKKKREFTLSGAAKALVAEAKTGANDPALPDEAPETPKTAVEPPKQVETTETTSDTPKTPPEAAESVPAAKKPWEDLSAGGKGVNVPMSPELYAKMKWVTENVPKMSLQKIARMGADAECDRLIAQFYKP
ncbi:MAG: hypothetical protein WKG03_00340 [Telluria sp.]